MKYIYSISISAVLFLLVGCKNLNNLTVETDLQEHNYAGYYIEVNTQDFDPIEFITHIYGEIDSFKNEWFVGYPYRDINGIRISYFDDGVFIGDHSAYNMIVTPKSELQVKIQNYFNYPKLIFAIMGYESGGVAGYRLIEKKNPSHAVYTLESDYIFHVEGRLTKSDKEVLGHKQTYYPDYSRVYYMTEKMSLKLFGFNIMNENKANSNQFYVIKK